MHLIRRTPSRYAALTPEILRVLQDNPGEWRVVHVGATHKVTLWKSRGCDAASETINGQVFTMARWPITEGDASVLDAQAEQLDDRARALRASAHRLRITDQTAHWSETAEMEDCA